MTAASRILAGCLRVTLYAMIATVVALPVTDAVGPIVRAIAEAWAK